MTESENLEGIFLEAEQVERGTMAESENIFKAYSFHSNFVLRPHRVLYLPRNGKFLPSRFVRENNITPMLMYWSLLIFTERRKSPEAAGTGEHRIEEAL